MTGRRVIFLDRDGTINVDFGYVHRPEQWEFTPGAVAALRALSEAGYGLAVVANQGAVGAGRYSARDVRALHEYMARELAAGGVRLAAVVFCGHTRAQGCACRKPAEGLARRVEVLAGPVDYAASWMIGDKESDVLFGKNIGSRTVLLRSRYWQEERLAQQPDIIVDSLSEAASRIVTGAFLKSQHFSLVGKSCGLSESFETGSSL